MSHESDKRRNPFLETKNLRRKNINSQENYQQADNRNNFNDDDADDVDDINTDSMAASYSEISFHANYNANINENENCEETSDTKNNKYMNESDDVDSENDCQQEQSNDANNVQQKGKVPQRPASLICDKAFPYNLEGTVSKDGDMTYFVAENLEYKIKLSSPITKKDSSQAGSSRNSTPSASGLFPRQFFLPQQTPQIDSNVLNDIEIEAQYLAASVDNLTENLCNLLHSISSITADNVEIHKNTVNKLTDNMDANIKSMYTIMAKTEEISKSMKPTEQLASRIREIKRLVDMLDGTM